MTHRFAKTHTKTRTKRPHESTPFASPATGIKFRKFRPLGEQIVRLLSANCGRTRHDPSVPVRGHACGGDWAVLRLYSVTTFLDELGIDWRANAEFFVKPHRFPMVRMAFDPSGKRKREKPLLTAVCVVTVLTAFAGCERGAATPEKTVEIGTIETKPADLQRKAQEGDAEAKSKLADRDCTGEGVPKDVNKAMEWYRKAAEKGHADAQYKLGLLHLRKDLKRIPTKPELPSGLKSGDPETCGSAIRVGDSPFENPSRNPSMI